VSRKRLIGLALGVLDIAGIGAYLEWGQQPQPIGAHNAEFAILFILTALSTYFLFSPDNKR
jgi:hypothetical protein